LSQAVGLEKTIAFALRFVLAPVLKHSHIFNLSLLKGNFTPTWKRNGPCPYPKRNGPCPYPKKANYAIVILAHYLNFK
jgi:hypothetical protein